MASKVLTAISLIVELISTVLLFYIAYLMYKGQCVQNWLFLALLSIPVLVIVCLSFILLSAEMKKTMIQILSIMTVLLLIAGFIFKIWFFIKMMGCDNVNVYLKAAFIILIFVSAIINYYNK